MKIVWSHFLELDYTTHIVDQILTMDFLTFGLITLPIVVTIIFGLYFFKGQRKHDTMQRNGSKASQNSSRVQKDSHSSQQKNDSCDSNNGKYQQHQQNSKKQRKTQGGGNNKRQEIAAVNNPQSQQKRSSGFSVDDWLGRRLFCYDRTCRSSSAEDNTSPRHNPAHRNSTSSETGVSEDFNLSSSNEDVASKVSNASSKKSRKSRRQQRQQRNNHSNNNNVNNNNNNNNERQRKQQQQQSHNENNDDNSNHHMDIYEDTKENRRNTNLSNGTANGSANNTNSNKNSNQHQQQQNHQHHHQSQQMQQNKSNNNLRKQCSKTSTARGPAAADKQHQQQQHYNGYNNSNNNSNSNSSTNSNSKSKHTFSEASLKSSKSFISNGNKGSNLSSASSSMSLSSTGSSTTSSPSSSPKNSPTASPIVYKRNTPYYKRHQQRPPSQCVLDYVIIDEQELIHLMRRYVIDPNLLRIYGYPVESKVHEGCIEIFKCLPKHILQANAQHLVNQANRHNNVINSNDGLYINGSKRQQYGDTTCCNTSTDSGRGSGDSSPPSLDSDSSETGEDESNGITAFYTPDGVYQIFSQYDQSLEKQCVRCKSAFLVTSEGEYLSQEPCFYHWGKLNPMYDGETISGWQYNCCQGEEFSIGCCSHPLHVWTGAAVGLNGPYNDFVYTQYKPHSNRRHTKLYALDCEMSFTGRGLEVTKVTLVSHNGALVYETFVRPQAEIVDYNTRFSGITEEDLCIHSNSNLKTLQEVQQDLLEIIDADTLLIGHGLDNDLRVLRIVHKNVIDTSISFPHASGFPFRRALRHLMKVLLNRDIQTGDKGHSSFEDSRACLELMIWKLRRELRIDFFD